MNLIKNNIWLNYFRPDQFIKKYADINVNNIKKAGIRMVICDLDNTLAPHFIKNPSSEAINFCKKFKDAGIIFILASNNFKKRVELFNDLLEADDFIYNAKKPFMYKIKAIFRKYECQKEDVIFIGDQFITDVLVANRFGCKSILVSPVFDTFKTKRVWILKIIEDYIYQKLQHNNLITSGQEKEVDHYDVL